MVTVVSCKQDVNMKLILQPKRTANPLLKWTRPNTNLASITTAIFGSRLSCRMGRKTSVCCLQQDVGQ